MNAVDLSDSINLTIPVYPEEQLQVELSLYNHFLLDLSHLVLQKQIFCISLFGNPGFLNRIIRQYFVLILKFYLNILKYCVSVYKLMYKTGIPSMLFYIIANETLRDSYASYTANVHQVKNSFYTFPVRNNFCNQRICTTDSGWLPLLV
jgi:hypothetical protein